MLSLFLALLGGSLASSEAFYGPLLLGNGEPTQLMNFMAWAPPFVDSVSPPGVDGSAAAGLTAVSGLAGLFLMRPPARLLPEQSLEPLLEGTNLGCPGVELSRAYKGSVDGWSSVNFHRAVDGKGSAIVIAQTTTGAILGGYNAAGWRSSDDYISSTNCFLFSYKGQTLSKYEVIGSGDAAIYDYSKEGPRFGSDALIIGPGQSATMGLFAGPDNEDISFGAGDLREAKASGATMSYAVGKQMPRGNLRLREVEVWVRAN